MENLQEVDKFTTVVEICKEDIFSKIQSRVDNAPKKNVPKNLTVSTINEPVNKQELSSKRIIRKQNNESPLIRHTIVDIGIIPKCELGEYS